MVRRGRVQSEMDRNAGRSETDASGRVVVAVSGTGRVDRPSGMLAQLRIRKKLILLHTVFSVLLAGLLLAVLRPTVNAVVQRAEFGYAGSVLERVRESGSEPLPGVSKDGTALVRIVHGSGGTLGDVPNSVLAGLEGSAEVRWSRLGETAAVGYANLDANGQGTDLVAVWVTMPEVRSVAVWVFLFVAVALLVMYASVAAALEMFVLPQHVYGPIRRMLSADRAVQAGEPDGVLIPERYIPADELGEIMRSRNASVVAMRRQERQLASALSQLEHVANDLRRKNHLLETAKRNLADTDRLASLGILAAGIAHELNTPLSVAKGLVEKLSRGATGDGGEALSVSEIDLLMRVVGRLERVSEGLLDFARVRPPTLGDRDARSLASEAITLIELDRSRTDLGTLRLVNSVPEGLALRCDGDRILQVLVNLVRNGIDSARDAPAGEHWVTVGGSVSVREGERWVSIVVADTGPGIDPEVLPTLFEPFVSTRLDAHGTGLGLAVSQGIAQEHGGVILARNLTREDGVVVGAEFELLLPVSDTSRGSRAQ